MIEKVIKQDDLYRYAKSRKYLPDELIFDGSKINSKREKLIKFINIEDFLNLSINIQAFNYIIFENCDLESIYDNLEPEDVDSSHLEIHDATTITFDNCNISYALVAIPSHSYLKDIKFINTFIDLCEIIGAKKMSTITMKDSVITELDFYYSTVNDGVRLIGDNKICEMDLIESYICDRLKDINGKSFESIVGESMDA